MSTQALVPVQDYLCGSWSPDLEYVDGVLVERNVGEKDHSKVQRALLECLQRYRADNLHAWPEQRVQVKSGRFRIPDVCITVGEPDEQVFTRPPLACIEILSPRDTLESVQEKVTDYLQFGVPYVWLINPRTREAHNCTGGSLIRAADVLETAASGSHPHLRIDLAGLFLL